MSPTFGRASLTALVSRRSARCGVSVAVAVLLVGTGSNWSLWVTVAVLVSATGLTTVAWMVRVALVAPASVPTVHRPVLLTYEPRLGTADTKLRPAGSR